jgi:hypothetical protein
VQGCLQCDYVIESNPEAGRVLDDQAMRIDRLRMAVLAAAAALSSGDAPSEEERLRHIGCRTAGGLQTSENRASLKKALENVSRSCTCMRLLCLTIFVLCFAMVLCSLPFVSVQLLQCSEG